MTAFSKVDTREGSLPLPGICKSCGSATKEIYLDTGTQENDYGAILFCVECVTHIASLFGFLHPPAVDELRRLAESQYLQNITLRDRVDQLKGAVSDLVISGYSADIDFVELDLVHLSEIVAPKPSSSSNVVEPGESTVTESDTIEGSDSLPSNGKQFSLFDK